ncbi:hypothetical protein FQA39_LY13728 [Lamprigera yunnana]|nr:hypothetical protein FQA39_LY13728 [Lamprigera yunnana]
MNEGTTLDKHSILNCLSQLNADNPVDWTGNLTTLCKRNIETTEPLLEINLPELNKFNPEESPISKYLKCNINYLLRLGVVLEEDDFKNSLSVQEIKDIQNIIRNVVGVGISSNILPILPYSTKLPSKENVTENVYIFKRYQQLTATIYGLFMCLKYKNLKTLILPQFLKSILIGLYQIIYCPIKKPSEVPYKNSFIMTPEIYDTLMSNRETFSHIMKYLAVSVHRVIYIRDTMMLNRNGPVSLWLKHAISSNLTQIMRTQKGVEHVAWAMLDAAGLDRLDDSTKSWKVLDIMSKLIMRCTKLSDFRENICKQVLGLLELKDSVGHYLKPFERLFTLCTSLVFDYDRSLCEEIFIKRILDCLSCFTNEKHKFTSGESISDNVAQSVRILHSLIMEESFKIPLIKEYMLNSIVVVLFRLYIITFPSQFTTLNSDIRAILLEFLCNLDTDAKFLLFDVLLFDFNHKCYPRLCPNVKLNVTEYEILVNISNSSNCVFGSKVDALVSLSENNNKAVSTVFVYLLNCLCKSGKYFSKTSTDSDLLHLQQENNVEEALMNKMLVAYKLASLAPRADIVDYINSNPSVMISFIRKMFLKAIKDGVHMEKNIEKEEFQLLFIIVQVLEAFTMYVRCDIKKQYKILVEPMQTIISECPNYELSRLVKCTLDNITIEDQDKVDVAESKVDQALRDICDPLLAVRGHGLLTLSKLIKEKDKDALQRKMYILNIFQQYLKDDDSFIYLNAIEGLASMASIFPETVIKVLAVEYADFLNSDDENAFEVRMKIGEVLVRTVKCLGETASLYKPLLLNTFLATTKDHDHLIRASSLSNLGEICRALGYKLGSIVHEVLACVLEIIATDKAPEPRRAAVLVITQLFVGLQQETIVFLKDEILVIYRSLKNIYCKDDDEIMKLQAQLALEKLNEIMKGYFLSNIELLDNKKDSVIISSK